MSIKKTLLAAALAAFAFTALPAVASAYEVDYEAPHFTVSGGHTELTTPSTVVTCTSVTGTGEFANSTSGTVKLTFHGCKASGTNCKSAGQANGTITTTTLGFDIGTTPSPAKPEIVMTPNAGHFATFTCAFGLVKVVVSGNGVVGAITSPGVNEESSEMTLNFETEGGKQVLNEADLGEGAETFELEASVNGGEAEPAGQDGEGIATFSEGNGILTE